MSDASLTIAMRNPPRKAVLRVSGMHCASCVGHVEKALARTAGVSQALVNLAQGKAYVDYDPAAVTAEALASAVTAAGYDAVVESSGEPAPTAAPSPSPASPGKAVLRVSGMHCASCVGHVEKALARTAGVSRALVNLAQEKAYADYDPATVTAEALASAVTAAGYKAVVESAGAPTPSIAPSPAAPRKAVLRVTGMHCASCVGHVEKALAQTAGVSRALVNLAQEKAYVDYDPAAVTAETLAGQATSAGYPATVESAGDSGDDGASGSGKGAVAETLNRAEAKERRGEWVRLVLAWVGSGLSLVFMMAMAGRHGAHGGVTGWLEFACAAVAGAVAGFPVLSRAWRQAVRGRFGMDVLIALGVTASLGSGILTRMGMGGADFSMVGGMIMAFHLTGRWLESRARHRATREIAALAALSAATAFKESPDGRGTVEVPVHTLAPGDVVQVRAGEKIPQDGEVVEGAAGVDESLMTGESIPVVKRPGDAVIGATINTDGFLRVRVSKTGDEAFLSQIIRLVSEAQAGKAPIQLLADRVTGVFVPAVLGLAVLAAAVQWLLGGVAAWEGMWTWAAGWLPWMDTTLTPGGRALSAGIATLVIACPCALGLATPMALTVGLGAAARRGILFRNAGAVQTLQETDVVLLDKTGTVTRGRPTLVETLVTSGLADGFDAVDLDPAAAGETASDNGGDDDGEYRPVLNALVTYGPVEPETARACAWVYGITLALERHSTHPVARAIREGCGKRLSNWSAPGSDGRPGPLPPELAAKARSFRVTDWKSEPGRGVEGTVGGKRWRLGSLSWARSFGVRCDKETAEDSIYEGLTPSVLFDDGQVWAVFKCGELARAEALDALTALRDLRAYRFRKWRMRRLYLVTGDRRAAAERMGTALGLDGVEAEVKPEEKLAVVRRFQAEGAKVAMVGDGVNDAPALKGADVGVAIGTGAEVAREAGDVLLTRGGLGALAEAFRLSAAIFRNIKQNLFWAFFYNLVAMPLAFLGWLHPLVAEAAMAVSSLTVCLNALRLRRLARDKKGASEGTSRNSP